MVFFQISEQLSAAIASGVEFDLINAYDSATDVVKEAEQVIFKYVGRYATAEYIANFCTTQRVFAVSLSKSILVNWKETLK